MKIGRKSAGMEELHALSMGVNTGLADANPSAMEVWSGHGFEEHVLGSEPVSPVWGPSGLRPPSEESSPRDFLRAPLGFDVSVGVDAIELVGVQRTPGRGAKQGAAYAGLSGLEVQGFERTDVL